ncbi:MAG: HupE/UreJ protein [Myxococcales bacterium]|nr:HupE/UreJ protein [Myxococcales bacterium]
MRSAFAIAICLLGLAAPADAHPLDLGYLRIETNDRDVSITLDLDAKAAAIVLCVDPSAVDANLVRARAADLAAGTYALAPITTDRGGCAFTGASAELVGRNVKISGTASCAGPGLRHWAFPVVEQRRISPVFQLMVKETVAGSERLTLVDQGRAEISLGEAGVSEVGFMHFLWSGVEHIGAAPNQWHREGGGWKLPDGIDHIVFLLALLLAGGTLVQLVGVASGFTLGHSITLALAALDIARPPARIIEPLIALTIALAAVEAFTGAFKKQRWMIATGFGLVHGFGFATALSALDLTMRGKVTALFGYNIGVEIGQVLIVLLFAPLVMLLQTPPGVPLQPRKLAVERVVVRAAACMIFMLGMYWFVVRALG